MKILHICTSYSQIHKNLVRSQINFGLVVDVFTYYLKKGNNHVNDKSEVYRYHYNSPLMIRGPFLFLLRIFFIEKIAIKKYSEKKKSIDCIHAHMLFTDGSVAYKLSKKTGIPFLVAVRNSDINSWFYWKLPLNRIRGYMILRAANKVVFLSLPYRDQLLERLPKRLRGNIKKKSVIIPNGIDNYWLRNKNIGKHIDSRRKEIQILSVGRIENNKNQISVSKAIDMLSMENYKICYHVIGEFIDKRLVKKLASAKNTRLSKSKEMRELFEAYRESDIFVLVSVFETFGLVYAEAMSQGLPVIYSKGQGFDEQFEDGMVGYSVKCFDIDGIAKAIKKIIDGYDTISANCIANVDHFDWEVITKQYIEIYTSVVKKA